MWRGVGLHRLTKMLQPLLSYWGRFQRCFRQKAVPDASSLFSRLRTELLAQPLGKGPGMSDIAGMVTGKRDDVGAQAFCQCDRTLRRQERLPGTPAG